VEKPRFQNDVPRTLRNVFDYKAKSSVRMETVLATLHNSKVPDRHFKGIFSDIPHTVTMWHYAVLAFLPLALGCTNPDTDPCASFMEAQLATASPFCATFTQSVVTATTGLPSWASNCNNKPSAISKECSCYFTAGGRGDATPTTTLVTVTSNPTGPTETAPNNCGAAPVDGLVGYAAGVTGGGSGSGTTVTSCSGLSSAISGGGVIKISGILTGCGILDLKGSTTVIMYVYRYSRSIRFDQWWLPSQEH
jgi:hypothetical protein